MFVDVRLPDGDGHQFLERVGLLPDRPPVVMITGHGTIESAVACMRAGAFDYLIKPFTQARSRLYSRRPRPTASSSRSTATSASRRARR